MPNDKLREVKHRHRALAPQRVRTIAVSPSHHALDQPRQLSDRARLQSDRRKVEIGDVVLETFTLPLEAARLEVRAIIGDISKRGYRKVVEHWRQLPDGQIEFTLRRLPAME